MQKDKNSQYTFLLKLINFPFANINLTHAYKGMNVFCLNKTNAIAVEKKKTNMETCIEREKKLNNCSM